MTTFTGDPEADAARHGLDINAYEDHYGYLAHATPAKARTAGVALFDAIAAATSPHRAVAAARYLRTALAHGEVKGNSFKACLRAHLAYHFSGTPLGRMCVLTDDVPGWGANWHSPLPFEHHIIGVDAYDHTPADDARLATIDAILGEWLESRAAVPV